jgi:hypothetical protein
MPIFEYSCIACGYGTLFTGSRGVQRGGTRPRITPVVVLPLFQAVKVPAGKSAMF